jgi:vancomycin aglycone glucosyltransferase
VQPALALALELHRLGHAVRLCLSPNFVAWAGRLGLEARPMGVEMRMPAQKSGVRRELTAEELRRLRESMPDLITDQFDILGAAAPGCDVIVGGGAHQYAAPSIAEHLGIGCVTAVYAPLSLPSPELAPPRFGETLDAAGGASIEQQWRNTANAWNERALERVNRNRSRLGMDPIDDVLDYVLTDHTWLAADATLGPAPATPGREVFQTGTWVLSDSTPLPAEVEAFLERGEPPVFVGFGSMPVAGDAARLPIAAARAVGCRIIVSRGWADLELIDDAPDCLAIGDVSHDALFARVAAVVHHGGAGTTAAAARAGVPQIITPTFGGDQIYWGRRVADLGVGTAIPHAAMTEALLAEALREVRQPGVLKRARSLAGEVSRDGAEVAAKRLEAEYGGRDD